MEYILTAMITVGLLIMAFILKLKSDEIQNLRSDIESVKVSRGEDFRAANHSIAMVIRLIKPQIQSKLDLVLRTDYPGKSFGDIYASYGDKSIVIEIKDVTRMFTLPISDLINRANELELLQSKLCCKKPAKRTK